MNEISTETRWFVIALIGGEAGAALGLLLFGGILFVPMLCALAGSALAPLGVWMRRRYTATPPHQLTSS